MNIISIVVGDWSGDGHSKTDTFYVSTNASIEEIEKAYKVGSQRVGFNLSKTVGKDYEENIIKETEVEKLKAKGIDLSTMELDSEDDGETYYVHPEAFFDIWLAIVKLGNPELNIKSEKTKKINIGGYGLYY